MRGSRRRLSKAKANQTGKRLRGTRETAGRRAVLAVLSGKLSARGFGAGKAQNGTSIRSRLPCHLFPEACPDYLPLHSLNTVAYRLQSTSRFVFTHLLVSLPLAQNFHKQELFVCFCPPHTSAMPEFQEAQVCNGCVLNEQTSQLC